MTKYLNEWNNWVSNKPLIKEFDMGSYKRPTKQNLSLRDGTYLAKTIFFAIQKQINDTRYLNVAGRPINKELLVSHLTETEAFNYLRTLPTTSLDQVCEEIESKFNLNGMLDIIEKYSDLWDQMQKYRYSTNDHATLDKQIKDFNSFIGEVMPLGLVETYDSIKDKLYSTEQVKILISIMLFSGHHVAAVRDPNVYSASKVKDEDRTRFSLLLRRLVKIDLKGKTGDTCSKIMALFIRNIDNSGFYSNIHRIIDTQAYIDEIIARDDPDHIETYLKNLENLRKEYFENNLSLGYVTPTKKMYSDSNEFLLKASNLPYNARKKELYRGMKLDFTLTEEIIEMLKNMYTSIPDKSPLTGDDDFYLDGEMIITDKQIQNHIKEYFKSKTFNFHLLSSWSTDFDVAKSFAGGGDKTNKVSQEQNSITIPIIFRMTTKRGFGIEDFSEFPEEFETISGGLFKIKEINFVVEDNSSNPYAEGRYIVINGEQV